MAVGPCLLAVRGSQQHDRPDQKPIRNLATISASCGMTNYTRGWLTSLGMHLERGFMLSGTIREHR